MRPEDLRAYARRDWQRVSALKRRRWRERRLALGPGEGFRIAAALYQHARLSRPDWPSPTSRRRDLDHHIALAAKLGAVSRVPTSR